MEVKRREQGVLELSINSRYILIEQARSRREINKLMEQVVFLDIAKERRTV